jgi:hypothetical protein
MISKAKRGVGGGFSFAHTNTSKGWLSVAVNLSIRTIVLPDHGEM